MNKEYKLGSRIIMKKVHPCGGNEWEITRIGVDIKIQCVKCGRNVMMNKIDFDKRIKKVVE